MSRRTEFSEFWSKQFPQTPPLPWQLRQKCKQSWFRIYSLPSGKRYPENAEEQEIVLSRFHSIAAGVNGGSKVWLAVPVPSNEEESRYESKKLRKIRLFDRIDNISSDDELFNVFVRRTYLKSASVIELVRLISIDDIMASMIVTDVGDVIAPYDGGIDVIVGDPIKREQIKLSVKEWLSPRSDGL